MTLADLELRGLDVMLVCRVSPERKAAAKALGKRVGRAAHGSTDADTLVGSAVVPRSLRSKNAFVGEFHIDLEDERIFAHLLLSPYRRADGTKADLHDVPKGAPHTEEVAAFLAELFGGKDTLGQVTAHMRLRPADAPPRTSPPLLHGLAILEQVGAEYAQVGPRQAEGVVSFRWRRLPSGEVEAWLTYTVAGPWESPRPWEHERKRLLQLLPPLLGG